MRFPGAVVSGGALVRRNVAPGTLIAGYPARPVRLKSGQTNVMQNQRE